LAVPNSLIVADSVSWAKGRHTIRMGLNGDIRIFQVNNLNTSPNYTFSYFQTAFTPSDVNTGDPFASFLLGLPQQESARFSLHAPRWIQTTMSDSFRMTSSFAEFNPQPGTPL